MSAEADRAASLLASLGYKVTRHSADPDTLSAQHEERGNLLLYFLQGGILMSMRMRSTSRANEDRPGFLDLINTVNDQSFCAKFYADDDSDLVIESWYPGDYEESRFAAFLEAFEEDLGTLSDMEDAASWLV